MRLLPFPSEDIQVGIDISIDAIRLIAIDASSAPGSHPAMRGAPAAILSSWEYEYDLLEAFDSANPSSWLDSVCETLANELPEHTGIRAAATAISIPTSWMHWGTNNSPHEAFRCASRLFAGAPFFSMAHTASWPVVPLEEKDERALEDPEPHVFASVSENAILRIATTLQTRGYRVERVIPDGIAVGCRSADVIEQTSPCIVMMHRDGGSITLLDNGIPALVRTLPPINHSGDSRCTLPSKSPSTADVRNWSEIVGREIQATFDYYARCSGEWKFSDRVTAENPILFAGSLFPLLKHAGYEATDLLGQWSNEVERPVALWSSDCSVEPLFQHDNDHSTESHESNPEQATALSLAMCSQKSISEASPYVSPNKRSLTLDDFNLLPTAFNLRNRHRSIRFRWAAALAIATVITLMFAINGYLHQRDSMRVVEDRVEVIEPIRSHLRQLESITGHHRNQFELIQKIAQQRPSDDGLQALAAIMHSLATQTNATQTNPTQTIELRSVDIHFMEGVWDIAGRSQSEEAIAEMANRLKATGWAATFTPPKGVDAVIVSALDTRLKSEIDQVHERTWVRHEDGSFRWQPRLGGMFIDGKESKDNSPKNPGSRAGDQRTKSALSHGEIPR